MNFYNSIFKKVTKSNFSLLKNDVYKLFKKDFYKFIYQRIFQFKIIFTTSISNSIFIKEKKKLELLFAKLSPNPNFILFYL